MSQTLLYKNIIEALNESELYKLAKLYLLHVEGIENVILCNGPWDSGIDLKQIDFSSVQYQATVEEKKLIQI